MTPNLDATLALFVALSTCLARAIDAATHRSPRSEKAMSLECCVR